MGADGSKPAPDGGSAVPVAADDEPQGGMRADGGSIIAVHNNYDANKKASDDADLRAVLALKEVRVEFVAPATCPTLTFVARGW